MVLKYNIIANQRSNLNVNEKINKDLLSKQTEMALKISSYAHFMCLGLFLILKFALHFDGPMPYFLLVYFIFSFSNTQLYWLHRRIVIVSILFFASSFITTLLISAYSGGLSSPFLGVVIVATMGSFISSLKHGRFFLGLGVAGFLLLFLNDIFGWIPDQSYTQLQQRYFALLTYTFIFIIAGSAGLIIAKTSFKGYQAKKEVEKQNLIIVENQKEIQLQKEKSDNLLLNILPAKVAKELRETGKTKPEYFKRVSILFADFKGFTNIVASIPGDKLIEELDDIFKRYDDIMEEVGLEKIQTVGDAYLAAGGLPELDPDHATKCVLAAQLIIAYLHERNKTHSIKWQVRIGIHSGPITAGVIGKKKFSYDLFGDTINIAARIESSGEPGRINVSAYTHDLIKDQFPCTYRGKIDAKGKGELDMYFVD